ncbi:contact-dependent growth inhibition system immunity protein [Janibacter hoylei]|uniref:contact-dependent growth inhibition system immunity protein n=1 Tax=Janibacter hoylei TaxID=364298 RepID=UPI002237C510|nr:contact-dependent growth inhibition system immunity protein [Janibacter hoylei]MCW4600953.1 contact-dependent growth inhibition system immunity protein [Janibacter hoylei]
MTTWQATATRYPALADLMGSGFHLDFWDFHESPEEVVRTFTGDPIFCARIPLEVEELFGEVDGPDREQRLDEVLWVLYNNFDYEEEGLSASEWLTAVRDQVVAETPRVEMVEALIGALVQALGSGRVFARGEGADVVATAVGESILVAFDTGKQLHLATRSLELVSDRERRQPHWEFDPADRGARAEQTPVVRDGGDAVDVDADQGRDLTRRGHVGVTTVQRSDISCRRPFAPFVPRKAPST